MKQFQFKLDSVLRLRQRELKESADTHRSELKHRKQIELEIRELELKASPRQARSQVIGAGEKIVPHKILEADRYRQELLRQIQLKNQELEETQKRVAAKYGELLEAQKNLKIIETLRTRHFEEWKQHNERRQQTQADEIASLRHLARR